MLASRTAVVAVLAALALGGCVKAPPRPSAAPRAFRLVPSTLERETTAIPQLREDVEVDTRDHDRTPHIVATGETPLITLDGMRARLFGDDAATEGWSVDNFLLLEVTDASGKVLSRAAIGFTEAVLMKEETVDNLGPMAFTFAPGQVEVTSRLPERTPFKIRATVLDYYGVGQTTDVYLVLDSGERRSAIDEDLRGQ